MSRAAKALLVFISVWVSAGSLTALMYLIGETSAQIFAGVLFTFALAFFCWVVADS